MFLAMKEPEKEETYAEVSIYLMLPIKIKIDMIQWDDTTLLHF